MNKNITPFIDVLFTFLLAFVCIIILLKAKSEQDPSFKPNVIYQIAMTWEGNADIDLWAQDPKGRRCGFNCREGGDGSLFSLNRDCLGAQTTELNSDTGKTVPINEELISIRGIFEGEYIVNVHAYNLKDSQIPVKIKVKLIKMKPYKVVVEKEIGMTATGQEHTMFRFTVNKEEAITDINQLPILFIHQGQ